MGVSLQIGDRAPSFSLPRRRWKNIYPVRRLPMRTALVVVFSCNHCPYVQAYEDQV